MSGKQTALNGLTRSIRQALADRPRRARILLAASLAFNLLFAAFKLISGLLMKSAWVVAVGVYYAILAALHHSLLRAVAARRPSTRAAWRAYHRTAWLLLLLTLAMAGIVLQAIRLNAAYSYPGVLIYAFALYAFVKTGTAVAALIRQRHSEDQLLAASRCVKLACALMSILALQTALLSRFGDGDTRYAATMNGLAGMGIFLVMLGMCLFMLYRVRLHARSEKRKTASR